MKKRSFAKSLASVGLAAVCALGIVGCSEQTSDTPTYTGGVAATVNGVEIPEDKVTQAHPGHPRPDEPHRGGRLGPVARRQRLHA